MEKRDYEVFLNNKYENYQSVENLKENFGWFSSVTNAISSVTAPVTQPLQRITAPVTNVISTVTAPVTQQIQQAQSQIGSSQLAATTTGAFQFVNILGNIGASNENCTNWDREGTKIDGSFMNSCSSCVKNGIFLQATCITSGAARTSTWVDYTRCEKNNVGAATIKNESGVLKCDTPINRPATEIKNIIISNITFNSAIVTWEGGDGANNYDNYATSNSSDKRTPVNPNDALTKKTATFSNLLPNTNYNVWIFALVGNVASSNGSKQFKTLVSPEQIAGEKAAAEKAAAEKAAAEKAAAERVAAEKAAAEKAAAEKAAAEKEAAEKAAAARIAVEREYALEAERMYAERAAAEKAAAKRVADINAAAEKAAAEKAAAEKAAAEKAAAERAAAEKAAAEKAAAEKAAAEKAAADIALKFTVGPPIEPPLSTTLPVSLPVALPESTIESQVEINIKDTSEKLFKPGSINLDSKTLTYIGLGLLLLIIIIKK
jgi:chemotaxis protein histidine kinase CheA